MKGLGKSAAEKHAAQLEKWVASIMEDGEQVKGILVANTWRDVPLAERTAESFPSQMLPYAKSRGHCLITGLQLFVILDEVEKDPSRASYWRQKILGTAGVLGGCDDRRAAITEETLR